MREEFKGKLDMVILSIRLQPQRHWIRLRVWHWRVWFQNSSWELLQFLVNSRKLL